MKVKEQQRWSVWIWVGALTCTLSCPVSAATARVDAPKRLVVVAFPLGEGLEAQTVRSLVPGRQPGEQAGRQPGEQAGDQNLYQLVPIDELRSPERTKWTTEIQKKTDEIAEKARESALAFQLDEAAEIWRHAADELLASDAVPLNPTLVASFLLEAGSASVQAGDNYFALVYFRKAIAIDLAIRPGPTLPPETFEIFEKALKLGPWLLQIPGSQKLLALCEMLKVDGVLWISAGTDEQGLQVAEKIMLRGNSLVEPEIRHHPGKDREELESWIASERQRIHQMISLKLPQKVEKKKPWYKKWWVYAVAGGALAVGGAVAGIVLGTQQDSAKVDIVVHH